MRLSELDATFVRVVEGGWLMTDSLAEAQGVEFLCPVCFQANGGRRGTHMILCWSRSRGAPDDLNPLPGRWKLDGTSIADLTLNADVGGNGNRSVLILGLCNAHFHVTNGEIQFC